MTTESATRDQLAPSRLRRTLHFVPGANERMLEKSLTLEADSLVLDLEDAVTPENKDEARQVVAGWLREVEFGRQERTVRMNSLQTSWGLSDLEVTMEHPPDAFLVPKIRSLEDVEEVDHHLSRLEQKYGHRQGQVRLILIATETPQGVLNLGSLTGCSRVDALTWGAEDLSAALGAKRNRDAEGQLLEVFRYCRTMTLLAAKAGGAQAIDSVFVDVGNPEGLRRECEESAAMGYTGKITIHPSQVPIVNDAFTPSPEEIAEARELVEAFVENRASGRMAFRFRGQMVDVPHLERARRLLELARLSGS